VLDGWAKIVNKQGQPIVRKSAEAEDVLYMLTILDVNKVDLPKSVAEDLDRVLIMAGCWSNDILEQCDATKILQRLDDMEKNFDFEPSTIYVTSCVSFSQRHGSEARTHGQRRHACG